ncbi:MAG: glycoside hydrolase family 3 C-terminal domain-containing protein, partial [Elusimicrobia bacterium]|nr:glycoside hydrolase family 3 C-terminal domain-containing protein [Elusimicrobiota bacterium]
GFHGFVVSDWDAVSQLIPHGIAADGADAARLALNAGVDMEMDSRLYGSTLPKLLKEGRVSTSTLDEAVRRILRVKMKLGLFERPYADESRAAGAPDADSRAAARAAAVKSMVLLKNEGAVLPLRKDLKNIAVIGPVGDDGAAVLGSWFGDGRSTEAVTVLAGIRAALPNATVVYSTGCSVKGETDEGFAAAVAAAKNAEAVILTLGEAGDMTGEATSRAFLDLPGRQLDLEKAVLALGKPTVVVLLNGRPLTIPWTAEHAPSILEAWQPGTEGGRAVADVLFGDANPGGKLPLTFPRAVGQIPLYYDHKNTGRPPEDDNHYTSKYQDLPVTPLFPFGYGLSYAKFSLGAPSLSAKKIRTNGSLTVSTALENIGTRPGDEVVQLYIHRTSGSVTRPVRELKGFARISLKPGDKKNVSFELGPKELGFYGADMKWRNEPGEVEVYVGTDSAAGLGGRFVIDQ